MGIQINWQELLTREETYFIVVGYQSRRYSSLMLFVKVFEAREMKMY